MVPRMNTRRQTIASNSDVSWHVVTGDNGKGQVIPASCKNYQEWLDMLGQLNANERRSLMRQRDATWALFRREGKC